MLVMIRFSNIMLMMLNIQIFLSYFSQKCSMITYFLFLDKFLFFFFEIFHLVLAEPGLGCCVQLSLVAESGAALCGRVQATHRRGGFSCRGAQALSERASVVVVQGLSCSTAYGIFWTKDLTCVPCIGRQIPPVPPVKSDNVLSMFGFI